MKSVFIIIVNSRRLGMGPRTAFSIDGDFNPAENVNVLRSILVRLYRARTLGQGVTASRQDGRVRMLVSDQKVRV
jgi:hypothetical protein